MKNTDTDERILEQFFNSPNKEFHIRELSRATKISPPSVSKAVKSLEKKNLVTSEKGVLHKIRANLENDEFKNLKRVNNLKNIYISGLLDLLKEQFQLSTIILFGSYSRGEDAERSDIDIAILDVKEKKLNLVIFEKKLNRKINIEFVSLQNIKRELKNSIINGIILHGYIAI